MATVASKKINWPEIKAAYQRGEGSCRVLAERFKVSPVAVMNRCCRGKWKKEVTKIAQKVAEKVADSLAQEQAKHIRIKIERMRRAEGDIDASREQFATDEKGRVVMDMLNIKHMINAEAQADDIVRRSLGMANNPEVQINQTHINGISPDLEEHIIKIQRLIGQRGGLIEKD